MELATREVKLERQRAALRAAEGAWKAEDHPELEQGSVEYVRGLRELDRARWLELAEAGGPEVGGSGVIRYQYRDRCRYLRRCRYLERCTAIDVRQGRKGRREQLEALTRQGVLLASTSIVVTEINMGMRPGAAATQAFLRELEFYAVDWEVARLAGRLFAEWRQKGLTLSVSDVTIAAVCLTHDLTLLTNNLRDFPMEGMRVMHLPEL